MLAKRASLIAPLTASAFVRLTIRDARTRCIAADRNAAASAPRRAVPSAESTVGGCSDKPPRLQKRLRPALTGEIIEILRRDIDWHTRFDVGLSPRAEFIQPGDEGRSETQAAR